MDVPNSPSGPSSPSLEGLRKDATSLSSWEQFLCDLAALAPGSVAKLCLRTRGIGRLELVAPASDSEPAPDGFPLPSNPTENADTIIVRCPLAAASRAPLPDHGIATRAALESFAAQIQVFRRQADPRDWAMLSEAVERCRRELELFLFLLVSSLEAASERTTAVSCLDQLRGPAFVVDRTAKIVVANTAAQNELSRRQFIRLTREGRLRLLDARQSQILSDAIESLLQDEPNGNADAPPRKLLLRIEPEPADDLSIIGASVSAMPTVDVGSNGNLESTRFLVRFFDADTVSGPCVAADEIASAFKLTAAEASLAAGLCRGLSLSEYASRSGLKISTVRWHLHNALQRTGTRSQSDLIKHILSMLG